MVPPFILVGPGTIPPPGELEVFVSSSWYTEAPTIVNTWEAWNILRSEKQNFPLFWDRMR